jgi:lysozyme family protein
MFSGADMRGSELTMMDNAREAQDVVQPMVTPVSRGRQPEMADSPAPVDAPSIDVRSNEMLDKPKGIMNKPVEESSRADKLISQVFSLEGEYSTDKADTGNYLNGDTSGKFIGSNHGISADVLAKHLGKTPTAKDMRNLTKDTARDIYKNNYWDKFSMDSLPEDLQPIVFNAIVNSQGHAVKVMQKLLGVEEDGVIGPKTREAMKSATFTKEQFKDNLLEKYKTFATWAEHGKGWTNRFTELAKG